MNTPPTSASTALHTYLTDLYEDAGRPSSRRMRDWIFDSPTLYPISHTTITWVLRGREFSRCRWTSIKPIVVVLGGDTGHAHRLWAQMQTERGAPSLLRLERLATELRAHGWTVTPPTDQDTPR